MESLPLSGQHTARAFTPFLLETWSPCSHPFAILPVSAVSDAQKLATGNFLHVRAGSSEVLQTSNQAHTGGGIAQSQLKPFFRCAEIHGASGRRLYLSRKAYVPLASQAFIKGGFAAFKISRLTKNLP